MPPSVTTRLTPVPWKNVRFDDSFWKPRIETNRVTTLPYEYEQNKKTGALGAYQWEYPADKDRPWRIWVGDLGKWIEAASYSLGTHPDPQLEELVESVVQGILKGQKADGYLYSNVTSAEKRWANLRDLHEFYDVGHTVEGAVAYYEVTGRRQFLDAMCRCVDLLDANFGLEEGKKRGYDGHPEIELALVKLYRATGEPRYLRLSKFFVEERGRQPYYYDLEAEARGENPKQAWVYKWDPERPYAVFQAHQPVRQQSDAVGHAVRALYLYSGMADVAAETGDKDLLNACRRLWKSVTRRRMYVIGGAGSSPHGEAFTTDYDLPNETGYAETCANIALVFFAHRMLQVEADSDYADVMERALYNGVLSGISLDGKRFFYANHLTAFPKASKGVRDHVAPARQEWFGCACCPPNIARIIAGVGEYGYSTGKDALYVHLYAAGSAEMDLGGRKVVLRQQTEYPWRETVHLTVDTESPLRFALALRIPGWCRRARLKVNGKSLDSRRLMKKGYVCLRRTWQPGDRVELNLSMPVERIEGHPAVRMTSGKIALQRGPIVYCLEEMDNGRYLADIVLPRKSALKAEYRRNLLGGTVVIRGRARRRTPAGWGENLYRPAQSRAQDVNLVAVPYALWANRKSGEMLVWIRGD